MDEQRILDEMERMLAADDPRLAARLAAFGQPGLGQALRTRRARATLSVMVLVLIAAVAAVIYLMSMLRPASGSNRPDQLHHTATSQTMTPPAADGVSATPPGSSGRQVAHRSISGTASHCALTFPPRRCDPGTLSTR